MSLAPGTRLGPYEVTAQIGVGGMGEVYRATDTNIKRPVAIKVLPEAVATDPERLARFQREAEVLGALNHPNIAQIYGIEKSDGQVALVMELVDGPTLDHVIANGHPEAASVGERLRESASAAERGGAASATPEAERVGARSRAHEGSGTPRGGGAPRHSNSDDAVRSRRAAGLPLADALAIARQIAEALEAAHEQGIIHRDLKPANIKLKGVWGPTPTRLSDDDRSPTLAAADVAGCTVKVLDFGLARAMEPAAGVSGSVSASMSPTITSPAMTQMGMILGTAAYMSPEQARGRPVDRRADIWAFGCVLFEMLTGRRAFAGDDVSDTMASVLAREPDWSLLPEGVSPAVETVLRRCLQKDRRQRIGDMQDVRLALDGAFDTTTPVPASSSPPSPRSSVRPIVTGAAGLVVGAVATLLTWNALAPVPSPGLVRRSSVVMTVDETAISLDSGRRPSVDAAGRLVVVSGRAADGPSRLFVRHLDQTDAVSIPGTDDATSFALSPDGAWLAFVANQQLRKVAMSGGAPVTLAPMPIVPGGLAWVRSESVIVSGPGGLVRVPAAGGAAEPVTTVDAAAGEIDHRWPSITADGRTLVYVAWTGAFSSATVRGRSLESGLDRSILQGESPVLLPTGHLVFARASALWAVPIDRNTLETIGEPGPVVSGVASLLTGMASFAVADDGALVYFRRFEHALPMNLLDRSGAVVGSVGQAFDGVRHVPFAFSPDGRFLAVTRHPVFREDEVVVYDLERAEDIGVGLGGAGDSRFPVWTPDGTRLTFGSTRNGNRDIFEVPADLHTAPAALLVREGDQTPLSWTPDGQTLAFEEFPLGSGDIWLLPRDGTPVPLLADPTLNENSATFSPDGRWLAYVSNETGRGEVYVQGYPFAGTRKRISAGGGGSPIWARDGLYYGSGSDVYFVAIAPGADLPVRVTPQRLMRDAVAVSPDGQRFVGLQEQESESGSVGSLSLVVNWFEELKRLVPTN
jgi:serine/threonine protein kinase